MEKIKNKLTSLTEVLEERKEKYYSWLRNIIVTASGILSVLVSFHSKVSDNAFQHCSFAITILLIALGILTGSIVLYGEIHVLNRAMKMIRDQILQLSRGEDVNGIVSFAERAKIFYILEWICFSSFSFSIMGMVAYAISIDSK